MSLDVTKKVHKKFCFSNNLNKTSLLRRKVRKTSRRKRKRRRCGNGCSCTNNVNTAEMATTICLATASSRMSTWRTPTSIATGSIKTASVNNKTMPSSKISVNSKRKQNFRKICTYKWNISKYNRNTKAQKSMQHKNNNNNKCKIHNSGSISLLPSPLPLTSLLTMATTKTTRSAAAQEAANSNFDYVSPPEGTPPSTTQPTFANFEIVPFASKQSSKVAEQPKCCYLNNPQICEKMPSTTKQGRKGRRRRRRKFIPHAKHVAATSPCNSAVPATEVAYTELTPAACCNLTASANKYQTKFASESFASFSTRTLSNSAILARTYCAASTSSPSWSFINLFSRKLHQKSSAALSSSFNSCPMQKNKFLHGLFMSLLVLSLCHNKVLETSAASVSISNGELTSTVESGKILQLPSMRGALGTETGSSATTKNIIASSVYLNQATKRELAITQEHNHLQSSAPALESANIAVNQLASNQDNNNRKLVVEDVQQQWQTSANGKDSKQPQSNDYLILLRPKEKRQQHQQPRGQQLPQYLTSTQETSFSPNGRALEPMHNNTFASMSIVDGRLTVPMDTTHQQHSQPQHAEQQQYVGQDANTGAAFVEHEDEMLSFSRGHPMPIFDFGIPRNITARTGHMEAVIKCRVDRLEDKSVSWIRKRDLHILTVGKTTYTSDKRFQVTESKDAREWTLHVKSPQARDSGIYECQVNTEPKMSMAFQLNIIEISPDAKAVITGPADLYFKVGSAILLTCLVQQPSVKDIGPIHWYRGEHLITPLDVNDDNTPQEQQQPQQHQHRHDNFGTSAALTSKSNGFDHQTDTDIYDAGGDDDEDDDDEENMSQILTNEITPEFTQRIGMEQQLCDTIKSKLRISNAQKSDTGNYTCQPSTASSASVMVHVINDENPAAMQKSGAANRRHSCATANGGLIVFYLLSGCCCSCWYWLLLSPTTSLKSSSSSVAVAATSASTLLSSFAFTFMSLMPFAVILSCWLCHVIYKTALPGIDLIIETLQHLVYIIKLLLQHGPAGYESLWTTCNIGIADANGSGARNGCEEL